MNERHPTPMPGPDGSHPLVFPGWEVRLQERVLLVQGEPAKVGGRAFDVLRLLVEHAGRVVDKRDLLELAWPGRVVEENNLTVQITALRRLLGSQAIVNVSGVGYRLAVLPRAPLPTAAGAAFDAEPAIFGREAEIQALLRLVGEAPLVSVVGAGGVGKTTLARAVVGRLSPAPADGVHWIDLAPVRRGAPLLPLLTRALGLFADSAALADDDLMRALGQRQALIVLDNCEHLLDEAGALLAPLLANAAGLRWLVTSQEALRLGAESVYRLAPLAVPAPDAPPHELAAAGSLALFCERARAAGRRGAWTAQNLATAAELCRQLDGLPLALVIAAARAATLGLDGLRDQIGQRLRLRSGTRDGPSRHHSLLQTYEWSYGLLSTLEQRVFRRLEPFCDGFDIGTVRELDAVLAADGVATTEWEMLDALDGLLSKSLVQAPVPAGASPTVRLRLLESARDFARLQLETLGELQAVHAAHAEVVARRFAGAFADLGRWRDSEWGARYLPERRNVQAALAWACRHEAPDLQARLVAALGLIESFAQGSSELLQAPISVEQLRAAQPALRAAALFELGWAHYEDGSRELGVDIALQALADFEATGDEAGIYRTLARLIRMYDGRPGQQHQAVQMWQRLKCIDVARVPLRSRLSFESSSFYLVGPPRSLERLRQLEQLAQHAGFVDLAAVCRVNITDVLMVQGRDDEVVAVAREMLSRDDMLPRRRALLCNNLALSLVRLGRVAEARGPAREVLRAAPAHAHMVMDLFALAAAREGRSDDAAVMAGRSAAIKRQRDLRAETSEAAVIDETLQLLVQALGKPRLAELLEIGASMSTDAVLAMTLAV